MITLQCNLALFLPAMEPNATTETMGKMTGALPDTINGNTTIAQVLQCMNSINSGENAFRILGIITVPKNSTVTTAQENITNFLRITMLISVFGNTTTTDRYSITGSEPADTIAGGEPITNKVAPSVSSIAFEEVTKSFLHNVTNTASVENPYTVYMTTSGPGGATTPNGDTTTDTKNAFGLLNKPSTSQGDVLPAENPGSTTLLSTENTVNTITGKTIMQGHHDKAVDMATTFGRAPEDPPDNFHGKQ